MAPRLDLQTVLEDLLGSRNVYFQPPPTMTMEYPCIIYQRDSMNMAHADNAPYAINTRYQVTVVDRNPDSDIPGKVAKLPACSYDRFFTADQLNHDVFTLFF